MNVIIYFFSYSTHRKDESKNVLLKKQTKLIEDEFPKENVIVITSEKEWTDIKLKDGPVILINGFNYFLTRKLIKNKLALFKNKPLHIKMSHFPAISNKADFWIISIKDLQKLTNLSYFSLENNLNDLKHKIIEIGYEDLQEIYLKIAKSLIGPTQVFVETSNQCNLKCNECFNQGDKWNKPWNKWYVHPKDYGQMDFKFYKKILDKIPLYPYPTLDSPAANIFLTGMGEPFMNTDLTAMVNLAKKKGFFVSFTPNLTMPDTNQLQKVIDAGVDSITCSIDGFSEKIYAKNRGDGHFKNVWNNLHYLSKLSKRPQITLNYIIRRGINDQEIAKFKSYWLKKGFDVHLLNLAYPKNKEKFILNWENNYNYKIPKKRIPCLSHVYGSFIAYNGEVLACACGDQTPIFRLGNINRYSNFLKIKENIKYKKLFNEHKTFKFKNAKYCAGCLIWMSYKPEILEEKDLKITKGIGGTYFQKIK